MTIMRMLKAFALVGLVAIGLCVDASAVVAQTGVQAQTQARVTELAVRQAEDRRASTGEELATVREGLRAADASTVRVAVRAVGRLERPALIEDVLPLLRHRIAAVRAEAATAVAQAAQGWKRDPPAGWERALESAQAAIVERMAVERDVTVRAALLDTLGRLPYTTAAQVDIAERAIVQAGRQLDAHAARQADRTADARLGVAVGLFRLTRFHRNLHPFSAEARSLLASLCATREDSAAAARVRRVAVEGYLALGAAGAGDRGVIEAAARDSDLQVRRLAIRGAAGLTSRDGQAVLTAALADASPIVRMEAVRGLVSGGVDDACARLVKAVGDQATAVALMAIDELSRCSGSEEAVTVLARHAADVAGAERRPRSWHLAAHAIVSLATASPDRAATLLPRFLSASVWELRMYAARAAAALSKREVLEALAKDADDNVREVAIDALAKLYGHDADAIFVAQLTRSGNQVLRSAALALVGTPQADLAAAPLRSTLQRLIAEGRDNSHDARTAIAKALDSLGERKATTAASPATAAGAATSVTAASGASLADSLRLAKVFSELEAPGAAAALRHLARARARVTMRGVGVFELTLLPDEAPASVLRFARLAESGYYNGLTFHRLVPNFVIQGGSPGANEYIGDATFMRDEVGQLPQVRGAVGVSTRGRDTGDAQIYIDLVDNPRLDHEFTVFAQVSTGLDVVDRLLEGDVIDRIEIIAAPARTTP
jgi:cyclophilin family peptidyl-prolyl cis-trans isomerase